MLSIKKSIESTGRITGYPPTTLPVNHSVQFFKILSVG